MKNILTLAIVLLAAGQWCQNAQADRAPLGFPPYVDITSTPVWVTHDVTTWTIGGTNNMWVTNTMTWTSSAGHHGALAAAPSWVIPNIPLAVGANVMTVRGVDAFNRVSTDTVVITRGDIGTGQPFLDVTNEPAWVSYDSTCGTIGGSNNLHVVGSMAWANSLGGSGTTAAGAVWTISDIPLHPGANVITVTATNQNGIVSSDTATITRGVAGTGIPHVDITNHTIVLNDDLGPCRIGGTNNLNVVGTLTWTNTMGGCGILPATLDWEIDGIVLAAGTNTITVSGTNAFGAASSDQLEIISHLSGTLLQTVLHSAPLPPPGYQRAHCVTDWQDAHISTARPDRAAGSDEAMYLGSGERILVNGPSLLGLLPPDMFRARLRLYNGGYENRTPLFWRARLMTAAWLEQDVTWHHRAAGTPWATPGGDTAPAPEASGWAVISSEGYHDFDVTTLLRAWQMDANAYHGILIETTGGNAALYVAANNGTNDVQQQPYLLIDHTVVPVVDITNENTQVGNDVTTYTLGGTNSIHIIGKMTWSNSLMVGVYTFAAAPAWLLSDISLAVGPNVITVSGTNAYGESCADSVTITRADVPPGTGEPLVNITNENALVMNDISAWTIGGSNNEDVVGGMRWQNSLGGSGSFSATPHWTVVGIPLEVGANAITVTGTNDFGQTATDSITVTRREPGTGAPFIDITNNNVILPPEEMIYAIAGTNNAQVVGWMVWTNMLTLDRGVLPAGAAWQIDDLLLEVGHNVFSVYGTNKYGAAVSDHVTISRSPGPPAIAMTTTNTVVTNEVTSCTVSGTAGEYIVGRIVWSNELTGAAGSTPAAAAWAVTGIALSEGANVIRVTGTNMVGEADSAAVTITRLPAGSGAPEVTVFTTNTVVTNEVEVFTITGTNNHHVVGMLWWTNTLGGVGGSFAASADAWTVSNIALAAGDNVIAVTGTNLYGDADVASVTITRLPAGSGPPDIILFTANTVVTNEISALTVAGTNNRHVVGTIVWSNALAGSGGSFAAGTTAWAIANIPLAVGQNQITVIGTNLLAVSDTGIVSVIRMPEGNLAPQITITTPAASVTYRVAALTIAGSANSNTVGMLMWSNALTQASGALPAAAAWTIPGVALAVGDNVISLSGTNIYGLHHTTSVTITRLPIGSDLPDVTIVTTNTVVSNEVTSITISGTNNIHVVGVMAWTNAVTGGAGQLAASTAWSIVSIPLAIGANEIGVYGTNMFGQTDAAAVTITRKPDGSGAPDVILFTTNATVTNEVTLITLAGSNNHHVVGALVWSNRLTRVAGAIAAARAWTIADVPIAVGANVIDVIGTNLYGWKDTASVTITRLPYGSGSPEIIILTTNMVVTNEVTTCAVVGTNQHIVGVLHWTNLLTLARGTFAAVPGWTINSIGLAEGANVILVTGTNMYGARATATVTITRLPTGSGVPDVILYTTNTVVTNEITTYTITGTNNRHVVGSMLCTNTLTQEGVTLPAMAPWVVSNLTLAIGDNLIEMRGTNLYGVMDIERVTITRLPYGSGTPAIMLWATNSVVPYETTSLTIAGSNNHHVVGAVAWTNALNAMTGAVPATRAWQINAIPLAVGTNEITVIGTNLYGDGASASVTVVRLPAGSGAPDIVLLTRATVVTNAQQFFKIEGTNNAHVVGRMAWINHLTEDSGKKLAIPEWNVVIILDEGANVFEISGTNMYGVADVETVTITRLPAEINPPLVDILMADAILPAETTALAVTGVCSDAAGWLTWDNSLTHEQGAVAATPSWSIASVALATGTNSISVTATNGYGLTALDRVTIVRAAPVSALDQFTINYDRVNSLAELRWSNVAGRVDVHVCRETMCTTNPACWSVAQTAAVAPWQDAAAGQYTASFYRLASGSMTSAYIVGFQSVQVRQSDGSSAVENWLSSPFDFLDATGALLPALPFEMLGMAAAMNDEAGLPARRDIVYSQASMGGTLIYASRGNGVWLPSAAAATNWYRDRMYIVKINRVHAGASKSLTFYGRVATNDPAVVADVRQSDGVARAENWCAAWWPWRVAFDAAALTNAVTDETGLPARRDSVVSQQTIGGAQTSATRGMGLWYSSSPGATNLYPGRGYKIMINKLHTGAARPWCQPCTMP